MERVETYLSTLDGAVGRLCALRKRAVSFDEFERNLDTRDLIVHNLWDTILHEFWRLDYQQVYNAVWQELGALDEFARQIKRRLGS